MPLAGFLAAGVLLAFSLRPADPFSAYKAARGQLERAVREEGVRPALALLGELAEDPVLAGDCHALAHVVGYAAFAREGFTQAVRITDDVCGSGYLHGLIEKKFAGAADLRGVMRSLCAPSDGRCFHGMGHGLMYVSANNVPAARDLCRTLPGRAQRIQCAEGVFMEHFSTEGDAHATPFLDPEDPFALCLAQDEPERGVCAFYAPRFVAARHPDGDAGAMAWCLGLPEASRSACVKGVGDVAAKRRILDPASALPVCALAPDDLRAYCQDGIVSYVIVHFASPTAGEALCGLFPEAYRSRCRGIADGSRPYYPPSA